VEFKKGGLACGVILHLHLTFDTGISKIGQRHRINIIFCIMRP